MQMNLLLQLPERVLDVQDGLKDWILKHRDEGVQVISHLQERNNISVS